MIPEPVSLDPGYFEHPKVASAGPLAALLDLAGCAYCMRRGTDGYVPTSLVTGLVNLDGIALLRTDDRLTPTYEPVLHRELVDALVAAGRWESVPGGYYVHDYLDWNPSREEVENPKRRAGRERAVRAPREGGRFVSTRDSATAPLSVAATVPAEVQGEGVSARSAGDVLAPAESPAGEKLVRPAASASRALGTSRTLTSTTKVKTQEPESPAAHQQRTSSRDGLSTARDELFAALSRATGTEPGQMTPREARATGVALSEIVRAMPEVTPDEISRRAAVYRLHFSDVALTANALARHWSRCAQPPTNGQRDPEVDAVYRRLLENV